MILNDNEGLSMSDYWHPDQYTQFLNERAESAIDLLKKLVFSLNVSPDLGYKMWHPTKHLI